MSKKTIIALLTATTFYSFCIYAKGQNNAFGRPGIRPHWASAKNVQVGTYFEKESANSPLWFTNAEGMLTEVFFPTIDQGQIKDAQFLISDNNSFVAEEIKDLNHKVIVESPSIVRLVNEDRKGRFTISHRFFTLRDSATLVDEVEVQANVDGLSFYHLANPHLNNTGYKDSASLTAQGFLVTEAATSLEIFTTQGYRKKSVGFVGNSDGWQDLKDNFKMDYTFEQANDGNVATFGEINIPKVKGTYRFFVVYKFSDANDNKHQLQASYSKDKLLYEIAWDLYLANLNTPAKLSASHHLLYQRSLYTLRVHADKKNRGALIASLSIPWGETQYESESSSIGGYHLIWPRDLFHVSLALILAGDTDTAKDALSFLRKIQYDQTDGNWNYNPRIIPKNGAFPQNTWVDGHDYWSGLQIDQTAYPVHLFYQLYKREVNPSKKAALLNENRDMLMRALTFIKNYGPWSAQERWEENFGISPSSFSAAASALLIGNKIFPNTKEGLSFRETADTWIYKPNDNIDAWTFTQNGPYGNGRYYLRVSGCDLFDAAWTPSVFQNCHIANSSIKKDQREVVDQGFLQLVLLGIKPANDQNVKDSVAVVNQQIRAKTPHGYGWYRYSFDSYGENGRGKPWPLLSGEHGRYAIARHQVGDLSFDQTQSEVHKILESYLGFANDGMMIPEQVFENTGEGTGAATPLAWSHAEYIKLLWSWDLRQNIENPF